MRLLTIALLVLAGTEQVDNESGRVDQPVLRATGTGRPPADKSGPQAKLMARRAAEVVALRNLAAKLDGTRVEDGRGGTRASTDSLIRGFRYLPPRDLPDGTVECTVEFPLSPLHANHAEPAGRLACAENALHGARAELQAVREQVARMRAAFEARLTTIEGELAELRRLLAQVKAPASQPGGAPDSAEPSPPR